jgi:DNA-binding IclR family transcriptional regulator
VEQKSTQDKSSGSVQSLERAFDIIDLLAHEQHGLKLTDIANELDLHKSTVYRLISVLRSRGYVEKSEENNLYRLGLGFIELSSLYLNKIEMKTEAEPHLRELSRLVGQTVFFATIQDREVVYIDKFEQFNSLRRYSIIGQRRPLYCTALGKAMLLDKTDEEIRDLFRDATFKAMTPNTITNLADLVEELRLSRQRGWTRDNEEYEPNVQCIAAPVHDYRNNIIAAVSIAWNGSANDVDIPWAAEHVHATGLHISRHLGYIGS